MGQWEVEDVEHERFSEESPSPETPNQLSSDEEANVTPEKQAANPAVMTTAAERARTKGAVQQRAQMNRRLFENERESASENDRRQRPEEAQARVWERFVKPTPFPTGIAQSQRMSAWIDWRKQFKISISLAGSLTQKQKASLLFMSIGAEMQSIITAKNLMLEIDETEANFAHYDHLMTKLNEYFRDTTDATVDLETFSTMKQDVKETARDFEVRLMRQAAVCGLKDSVDLVKNQYIRGMQNRELSKRAFVESWKLQDLVAAAARDEAMTMASGGFDPWGGVKKQEAEPVEVAAVSEAIRRRANDAPRYRSRDPRLTQGRYARPFNDRRSRSAHDDRGKCQACGLREHRYKVCPAVGKPCNKCGSTGHFARVCKREVNSIHNSRPDGEDLDEVKIYT